MSRSRTGSLGRRLSYWLALQSLVGLVVICAVVYGATQLAFLNRQSEAMAQKQTQLQHLLIEAARDGDGAHRHHRGERPAVRSGPDRAVRVPQVGGVDGADLLGTPRGHED